MKDLQIYAVDNVPVADGAARVRTKPPAYPNGSGFVLSLWSSPPSDFTETITANLSNIYFHSGLV